MYAIIRAGGHQERVEAGEVITIDRLKQDVGEEVRYVPLMIHTDDGGVVSDRHELEGKAAVVGKVLEHSRGDKIDVFQYRGKTGYRRHIGARQAITLVEISEVRFGDVVERAEDKRKAAEEAAAKEAEAAAAEAAAAEGTAAPAKKPAARKKAPAKAKAAGAKKAPARKAAPKKA
jgi:large subunit ribosomal protein L21